MLDAASAARRASALLPRPPEEADLTQAANAGRTAVGEETCTAGYVRGGGVTRRRGKVAGDRGPNGWRNYVTGRMRFGLYGLHRDGNVEPDVLVRRAGSAEEAGFESLWVGDHIALPPGEGNPPRLEALVALTYLAAVTSRVRLGVGLIVLPQRQPVLLAKQLTSLDVLSGGRLSVAVGAGYVEPEPLRRGVLHGCASGLFTASLAFALCTRARHSLAPPNGQEI